MRFGGFIFKKWNTPEEWAQAALEAGYSAVYFPVDYTADQKVIDGYKNAAEAADLVICEIGVWNNVLERDAAKREAVIDMVTGDGSTKGAINGLADDLLKGDNNSVTDDLVAAVDSGRAQDVQEELDRLLRAGKSVTNLKSKITEVCKPEYLAGSDYDRQKLEEMLLALTDGDGNALYEQKTFATWLKNAEKAQTTTVNDPYADLR